MVVHSSPLRARAYVALGWAVLAGCDGEQVGQLHSLIELRTEALDFGEVFTGGSKTKPILFQSFGDAPTRVAGSTEAPFEVRGWSWVNAGNTGQLELSFAPAETGPFSRAVNITTDAENLPTAIVRASGVGAPHPACDDGLQCTSDAFDPIAERCVSEEREGSCDDGSACTYDDSCDDDECVGEAVDCDDDDPCTVDYCDPSSGCGHSPAPPCDDENPCTDDFCVPFEGCETRDRDDGRSCGPRDGCRSLHVCYGGSCYFLEGSILDGKASCEDGDACTLGDLCFDGECRPGERIFRPTPELATLPLRGSSDGVISSSGNLAFLSNTRVRTSTLFRGLLTLAAPQPGLPVLHEVEVELEGDAKLVPLEAGGLAIFDGTRWIEADSELSIVGRSSMEPATLLSRDPLIVARENRVFEADRSFLIPGSIRDASSHGGHLYVASDEGLFIDGALEGPPVLRIAVGSRRVTAVESEVLISDGRHEDRLDVRDIRDVATNDSYVVILDARGLRVRGESSESELALSTTREARLELRESTVVVLDRGSPALAFLLTPSLRLLSGPNIGFAGHTTLDPLSRTVYVGSKNSIRVLPGPRPLEPWEPSFGGGTLFAGTSTRGIVLGRYGSSPPVILRAEGDADSVELMDIRNESALLVSRHLGRSSSSIFGILPASIHRFLEPDSGRVRVTAWDMSGETIVDGLPGDRPVAIVQTPRLVRVVEELDGDRRVDVFGLDLNLALSVTSTQPLTSVLADSSVALWVAGDRLELMDLEQVPAQKLWSLSLSRHGISALELGQWTQGFAYGQATTRGGPSLVVIDVWAATIDFVPIDPSEGALRHGLGLKGSMLVPHGGGVSIVSPPCR
ncbi:MAG: hypothetical protein HY791_24805 [Deltaproteobacteria bacterium]|nr:hypothetical protein [Deltaproteobacteria bacterium]